MIKKMVSLLVALSMGMFLLTSCQNEGTVKKEKTTTQETGTNEAGTPTKTTSTQTTTETNQ